MTTLNEIRVNVESEKLIRHQFPVSVKFTGKYFSSCDTTEVVVKANTYLFRHGKRKKAPKNN